MQKLAVFNNVTVDGYFAGPGGDFSWAHSGHEDPEFRAFVSQNAGGGGTLLFGRVTYEIMAGYWPTRQAQESNPAVAEGMNRMRKVVFSRTLDQASWHNTALVKSGIAAEVRRMKEEAGPGLTILGSGSIVSQLSAEGLIDEYQMLVNPVVLGQGRTMFDGIGTKLDLRLTTTRAFRNGKVLLCYERA